jgi:DHA3 family multidrug efflux protein-like MFS transporter
VFTLAGFFGLLVTILAFNSRYYRDLSAAYASNRDDDEGTGGAVVADPA